MEGVATWQLLEHGVRWYDLVEADDALVASRGGSLGQLSKFGVTDCWLRPWYACSPRVKEMLAQVLFDSCRHLHETVARKNGKARLGGLQAVLEALPHGASAACCS